MTTRHPSKEYEAIVAAVHRQFARGGEDVIEDIKIVGRSGQERQIDVLIRGKVSAYPIQIVIDCKRYTRSVGIQRVDEMIGKVEDIGAHVGVIVSDSGFSKSAMARARQDGRIQLVSVIDVKNDRLRTRIGIPVVCDCRRPRMRLSMKGMSKIAFSIDRDFLAEMHNLFVRRWNEGELDSELGEHSFSEVVRGTDELRIEVEFQYEVTRRLFFKQVPLAEGDGIVNALTRTFTTRGFKLAPIDMREVETGWAPVNEEALSKAAIGLELVDTFPVKTPEEINLQDWL